MFLRYAVAVLSNVIFLNLGPSIYAAETSESIEQFLCVSESTSGVSYDEASREWKNTRFTADRKFIISPNRRESSLTKFLITEVGDQVPIGRCEEGFNKYGFLLCHDMVGSFRFNRYTGRFLRVYDVGYYTVRPEDLNTSEENKNTPFVMIGKCSKF